jgi:Zn-dependent metalloprotease
MAADNTFRSLRAALASHVHAVVARRRSVIEDVHKQRTISTARNEETLPGAVVRMEGGPPSGDAAVDEAYDGLGATFDLYWDVYERNSIDDEGLALDATVHYGSEYDNAFWNGQRMVFGDGDGELFNRFTISIDVIGHELTHGVVEDEAQLAYLFQAGALNESNADVFGSLVKQKSLNQTVQKADWLIGAGLFTKKVKGVALRSMKAPGTAYDDPVLGKDPQPAHMKDFVRTYDDNGGVHINSGIPNHAFYLTAMAIGGYAWEKAGRIWYETLRDSRLRPNTGFKSFAGLTVDNAGRLYGFGSAEQKAVRHGWAEVGIKVSR